MGGNPITRVDPTGEVAPAVAACLANPACVTAIRAGVGGIIGGLSGLAAALNDPCFDGSLWAAFSSGALVGSTTSLIPGGGPLVNAAVRGGAAGMGGNAAGQAYVNGGLNGFSVNQAVIQGLIGTVSGSAGNIMGLRSSLFFLNNGRSAASAITIGLGEGGTAATAISTSANLVIPTTSGGMLPPPQNQCECQK